MIKNKIASSLMTALLLIASACIARSEDAGESMDGYKNANFCVSKEVISSLDHISLPQSFCPPYSAEYCFSVSLDLDGYNEMTRDEKEGSWKRTNPNALPPVYLDLTKTDQIDSAIFTKVSSFGSFGKYYVFAVKSSGQLRLTFEGDVNADGKIRHIVVEETATFE
ncbi:MAG: hypothetical protein ACOYK6_02400 [Chthoniobacterales bacterium]